ncbi:hypothetical protein, partial [Pseudoalteromonas sp. GutCa3]
MNALKLFESTVELYLTEPDSFACLNGTLSLVDSKELILSEKQANLLIVIIDHSTEFRNFDLQIDFVEA